MHCSSLFIGNKCLKWINVNSITFHQTNLFKSTPLKWRQYFSTTPCKNLRNKFKNNNSNFQTLEPRVEGINIENGNFDVNRLWKPFFFTVAFSTTSIACAAIWQYENRRKAKTVIYSSARRTYDRSYKKFGKWRNDIHRWSNRLSDAEKIFIPLCALNVLVFLAWRINRFQPTMIKYFCSSPAQSATCWPMVLSTFSHYSALHIFANMYVLESFAEGGVMQMGKEQFLGFYMAAGVISSFVSYTNKVIFNRPGLSLGASGAILAVVGYMCTEHPNHDLTIIFLPFITFKAATAIKVMIGIDLMGVLMGWRFIDHAAHLGGAMFGIIWSYWGSHHIWQNRDRLLKVWHEARGPPKK